VIITPTGARILDANENGVAAGHAAAPYQFIHHSGERGFDRDAAEPVTFAHVERIA